MFYSYGLQHPAMHSQNIRIASKSQGLVQESAKIDQLWRLAAYEKQLTDELFLYEYQEILQPQ